MKAENEYVVRPGDTLSAIAQKNNVTVGDLVSINDLDNPRLIYPGQKLLLTLPIEDDTEEFFSELWIRVTDANGVPIPDLQTTIVTDAGQQDHVTSSDGIVPPVKTRKPEEKVRVFVAKLDGGSRQVAELTPPCGVHQATLRSPKLKISVPLRVHQGGADHQEKAPLPLEPGNARNNRDSAGNPVVNAGVECPNRGNLMLGANGKYREFILTASARTGIIPQGIAALISAEAALMPARDEYVPLLSREGKPIFDTKGKPRLKKRRISRSEWNPNVANSIGAVGLTQFLPKGWSDVARDKETMLHDRLKHMAQERGLATLPASEVLGLRTDPELSIVSAAEYARLNLNGASKNGMNISTLSDVDKAKLAYFLHHEGVSGAIAILAGTLSDEKADHKLALQFKTSKSDGTVEAAKYRKKVGLKGAAAYRKFIFDYVDTKIVPRSFACDPDKIDQPLPMTELATKLM